MKGRVNFAETHNRGNQQARIEKMKHHHQLGTALRPRSDEAMRVVAALRRPCNRREIRTAGRRGATHK